MEVPEVVLPVVAEIAKRKEHLLSGGHTPSVLKVKKNGAGGAGIENLKSRLMH